MKELSFKKKKSFFIQGKGKEEMIFIVFFLANLQVPNLE